MGDRLGAPWSILPQVVAPPCFGGEYGQWTQEARLLSAVEVDIFLTFLALARRHEIQVLDYCSKGRGTVGQGCEGVRRFTEIEVHSKLSVSTEHEAATARKLLETLRQQCLIGASLKCEPRILAEVSAVEEVTVRVAGGISAACAVEKPLLAPRLQCSDGGP